MVQRASIIIQSRSQDLVNYSPTTTAAEAAARQGVELELGYPLLGGGSLRDFLTRGTEDRETS